jgi:hypothetical protein
MSRPHTDSTYLKAKGFGFIVMLAIMVLGLIFNTGCGEKKSSTGGGTTVVNPTTPNQPTCSGCPNNRAVIASGLGKVIDLSNQVQMEMGLTFYGDSAIINQNQNQVGYYQGTVVAQGYLRILRSTNNGTGCQIPVGTYQVNPTQSGNWLMHSFTDIRFEANNGGSRIRGYLYNNYVTSAAPAVRGSDGNTYPYKIKQWLIIETVNGNNCGVFGQFYLE